MGGVRAVGGSVQRVAVRGPGGAGVGGGDGVEGGGGGGDRAGHLEKTLGISSADAKKFANYETMHGTQKMLDAVKKQIKKEARKKGRMKGLAALRTRILALFDTPEQAASEEAAELVRYEALRTDLDAMGEAWDAASDLVDELIADEEKNPTATPAQEEAETEVERARVESLLGLFGTMVSGASQAMSTCMNLNAPPAEAPRYMAAKCKTCDGSGKILEGHRKCPDCQGTGEVKVLRAAIGKEISAKNMKVVQGAHDASHETHAATIGLGAQCNGMKLLAEKECPACEGIGQVKVDDKQSDCSACNGTGVLKAAATNDGRSVREETMSDKKTELVKALVECPCTEFTAADVKWLEAASDERLEAFRAAGVARKAAQEKADAELKAAQEKKPELKTAEQFMAEAPKEIVEIVEQHKAAQAARKGELVTMLKAASDALTEDQLKAKGLEDLETLAKFAKIEKPDFSGRGIPRTAAEGDVYRNPPDPYAAGIAKMRGEKAAVN